MSPSRIEPCRFRAGDRVWYQFNPRRTPVVARVMWVTVRRVAIEVEVGGEKTVRFVSDAALTKTEAEERT